MGFSRDAAILLTMTLDSKTRLTRRALTRGLAALPLSLAGCASDGADPPGRPWHHTADGFRNPPGSPVRGGDFGDWAGFFFRNLGNGGPEVVVPDGHVLPGNAVQAGLDAHDGAASITWLGHASFLIRLDGLTVLTDPFLSDHASPMPPFGPKRFAPPALRADQLPPVDVILLSHNHYDHLDLPTLSRLAAAHKPRVITPLGNDAIMRGHDPAIRAEAHDWGASIALSDRVRVHVEPCFHWSARGVFDRRMALWAAFVIETPAGKIYHIGDTGYGDGSVFRAVREKHGDIRLAILPIGAYEPRWFMKAQHINPEESVKILLDCGARDAIAHHWGTFQLTNEGIDDPTAALAVALAAVPEAARRFHLLAPGQSWNAAVA